MLAESAPYPWKNEEPWKTILGPGEGHPQVTGARRFHSRLPTRPGSKRCKGCKAPLEGFFGFVMALAGRGENPRNPRYCNVCDKVLRDCPGGAKINMSAIFVDVRGSVPLSERTEEAEFARCLEEFFESVSRVLTETDGWEIERRGDCLVVAYPPAAGFSGPDHAAKAAKGALRVIREVALKAPDGTPLQFGIGAHFGGIWIGTVSPRGMVDITILGKEANITARLSQKARAGEALISDALVKESGLRIDRFKAERRQFKLEGVKQPISAFVVRTDMAAPALRAL